MKILTLNPGSNSLKWEIVEIGASGFGDVVRRGSIDDIHDHGHAAELVLDGIRDLGEIDRIAHRVVHGGAHFSAPAKITDDVIREIEKLEDLAPLHNKSSLAVIRAARERTKGKIPMFAVFDTVFHRSIPETAFRYALPVDLADRHHIRRYGFHGSSHKYLMLRHAELTGARLADTKLVTLHLEGGSSACAIRGGQSIDTSMGFTPLEGLMMGTRTGDLDPALVTYLMRKEKLDAREVETFLNKKGGLLGVSGVSADTRELEKHRDKPHVELALEMFAYRVQKYVGAYLAALGGANAIVVGGGIGENSPHVRELIFAPFAWAGAHLDRKRNEDTIDRAGVITSENSTLPVWVIPTDEGRMMAREVADT